MTPFRPLLLMLILLATGCRVYGPYQPGEGESPAGDSGSQGTSQGQMQTPSEDAGDTLPGVIEALDRGQIEAAEAALLRIIDQQPYSRLALRFLQQIQTDPVELMGEEHDVVIVQPGDSLSEIAQRELGDSLQFFALARYNGIDAPRKMAPGRALRIPRSLRPPDAASAPPVASTEVPGDAVDPEPPADFPEGAGLALAAQNLNAQGQTAQAYSLLLAGARAGNLDGDGERLLASLAVDRVAAIAEAGRIDDAVELIDLIEGLVADASEEPLVRARRSLDALRLRDDAIRARRAGELDAALALFEEASTLDPGNEALATEAANVRGVLVAQLHEQALTHYRDQELDQAIERWQRVEALAPDFESARIYLERAIALRARLEDLD
jgi:tetratricopeptide (TPR) repeat protein